VYSQARKIRIGAQLRAVLGELQERLLQQILRQMPLGSPQKPVKNANSREPYLA